MLVRAPATSLKLPCDEHPREKERLTKELLEMSSMLGHNTRLAVDHERWRKFVSALQDERSILGSGCLANYHQDGWVSRI